MTQQRLRWLLLAIASGLITFVAIRRRQQLAAALPQPLLEQAERFVIPWSTLDRHAEADAEEPGDSADAAEEADDNTESPRRKVSSTHRISFAGKRYGPLPEALVGKYVEVETSDGKLFILHDGQPVATFDLQA